ncbi:helix-turn-helix domain-containing protein [Pseudonocardia sp. HH130630-07]|uniref:helix-turn-helix domain-containing protein n=1 Tax=Pseudonocardia sp. HH130630-07 TaxID=1690815 RepID=UPI000814D3F7|nr:helix-turn-helix domain-containing protein [Pseudonocardia sp. HH130630-07]ANY07063.1 transcriptional regulator [Pseudonocardia sp. HH130630-07]
MTQERAGLERARDAALTGTAGAGVRPEVRASWARSLAAAVDPERSRPRHAYGPGEVAELRAGHPLAIALPVLRETLTTAAEQARHLMIVTDERGHILWREGARDVLRRAERVELVEGTRWSEDAVGTNAMGTALSDDRPVRIHSAEHLVSAYHPWTCAAAPVHDPETGRQIGTVDVTGPEDTFHPMTLSLVTAAARLAEHRLAALTERRDRRLREENLPHLARLGGGRGALLSPRGRVLAATPAGRFAERIVLPDRGDRVLLDDGAEALLEPLGEGWLLHVPAQAGPPVRDLTLPFLGARTPVVRSDGRPVRLGLRHAELLTLLALHPEGMTAEQLAGALYGDAGRPITVRAELHRLRCHLGEDVVRTQPYRLAARVDADFLRLSEALREGRIPDAAAEAARGPLLPVSEAPAVRSEREHLIAATRSAVLRSGDPDALWSLVRSAEADDELRARLRAVLPAADRPRAGF